MDKRFGRIFPLMLLAALFAGCATTQVSGPAKSGHVSTGAFADAAALARNDATLRSEEVV